jgi:CpeT/CpcT family (DUF1001)
MRRVSRVASATSKLLTILALQVAHMIGLTAPIYAAPLAPPAQAVTYPSDMARLLAWFGGEWNNNEQVWQQQVDAKGKPIEDKIPHTHHIFAPISAPKVGLHVFYVQQSQGDDLTKPYRQRLYRFSEDVAEKAIKLEIFNFNDEKAFFNAHLKPEPFATLDTTQLRATPGCEVFWRYDHSANAFAGTMKTGACSFISKRFGDKRIIINDTLKLTENEIWINDQARDEAGNHVFGSKTDTPVKNRKVRYFTGWVWIHRDGPKGDTADRKKFAFRRDIMIHDEGQRIPVLYDDGTPSPYLLELAQLTYQNTRTSILKMALVDRETKKSVFYIWAQPDGTRVGINHGWIQIGLTQKVNRIAYGFGDPPPAPATAAATPASAQ